jgi:hypothetical protein
MLTGDVYCLQERDDCFAYRHGCCGALANTDFGDEVCPFFSTREEADRQQAAAARRLVEIGRPELLNYPKYKHPRKGGS